MKNKYIILFTFFISVSVALSGFYYYHNLTRNNIEYLIDEKRMINILVAGSNRYRDNRHSFFMNVSINPQSSKIGITFIPPSFKISMDDRSVTEKKISELNFSSDFRQIRQSLAADLQLDIPFYLEIYSPDVERFVNLIGGIDVFVLDQVPENEYFTFGRNYLDGRKSVEYINTAEMNSVFIKFDRISDLILTLYSKKDKYFDRAGYSIITEIMRSVKTNLVLQEVLTLAEIVKKSETLKSTIVPGSMKNDMYVVDDISYKIYENDFYKPLVLGLKSDKGLHVKLLNGTNIPGLARKMRSNLIRDGLHISEFGTFRKSRMTRTILVNRKGCYSDAVRVSDISGIDNIYHITASRKLNDALIIIGEDAAK